MYRTYPTNEINRQEMISYGAKDWQIELLKVNPGYTFWGNDEDYMSDNRGSWTSPREEATVYDLPKLDDYNECVNFYFEIVRNREACKVCVGLGESPRCRELTSSFHGGWEKSLTPDEIEVLVAEGRIRVDGQCWHYDEKTNQWAWASDVTYSEETKEWTINEGKVKPKPQMPTLEEVNNQVGRFGHDAINRIFCVRVRAKRLGIEINCTNCKGEGGFYTESEAHVELQTWILYPRKGAARGLRIKKIDQTDLQEVFLYLKNAQQRNFNRFSNIDLILGM